MASAVSDVNVSHVSALTCAARRQAAVKHFARSKELFECALAAAEALGQPDCLIVANLRQLHLELQRDMLSSGVTGEDDTFKLAAAVALVSLLEARLPAVLETLERRRAQGTLCAGRCRAHEVAWSAGFLQAEALARSKADDEGFGAEERKDKLFDWEKTDDETVSQHAQYVGVEAYFGAAHTAVNAAKWLTQMRPHDAFTARCLSFLEHALQFALQPESRRYSNQTKEMHTSVESDFLHDIRTNLLPLLKPEAPGCAGVLAAWRDLELDAPLLHELLGEEMRADLDRRATASADAQAAKDASKLLRACALPSCGAREAHVAHFKKCGGCGVVFYCSQAHQAEHWPSHKAACKAVRKAAKVHDSASQRDNA